MSWRRWTSTLALAGLLFHVFLPLAHQMPAEAAASPFGDTMVICTATGFKVVPVSDLPGEDGNEDPTKSASYECPLCIHGSTCTSGHACAACLLPGTFGIGPSLAAVAVPIPWMDSAVHHEAGSSSLYPRAPPVFL